MRIITGMRTIALFIIMALGAATADAATLIVYYSYTNNVHRIVTALQCKIDADVVRVEPAQKGLDYAADNYAIGSAQIAAIRNNPDEATSYPAVDPVDVSFDRYDTVIIAAPLWWSSMAAPLQSFLFSRGGEMAGKNIALIVSSASSGISGVEADARRLVPDGRFLSPSLWIRSSQTADADRLLDNWLSDIDYYNLSAGVVAPVADGAEKYSVYSLSGIRLLSDATSVSGALGNGVYIINGKKTLIKR